MKEAKANPSKAGSSLVESGRRPHRGSVGSYRSSRSNHSAESSKSPKRRLSKMRPRRLSMTSMKSQAVSEHSSSSVGTNNLSRKTSHADDSDASDTNESLGETEEDVWFPTDTRSNGDINVDELDQLLNLSDEEETTNVNQSTRYGGNLDAEIGRLSSGVSTQARPLGSPRSDGLAEPVDESLSQHSGRQARRTFVEYTPSERFNPPASYPNTDSSSGEGGERRGPAQVVDEKPLTSHEFGDAGTVSVLKPGEPESPEIDTASSEEMKATELMSIRKKVSRAHASQDRENQAVVADEGQSQRYSFFASGLETTVHAPDLASLVGESNSFSSLFNPENGAWFLDCFRPTDHEMKAISRAFGIHPLTTEDIQTEDAREKYESFRNYYLVVYHTFENDKDDPNYMEAINFYMLVFREGVISFHFEPISHCRNVRRRMRQLRDYLVFTPDWIAYALIDDITDSFAPEIHGVEKEADFVEDAVYLDHDGTIEMPTLLRRLGEGRRHTMHLLRMLSGKADVVRGFSKRINERDMPSEMNLYLGDIQDHIVTMYQNLSAYEKIFSRTHFNYMGLLQMEFVDSSNRMTGVLGKVTILGTVLVPMNLITGLFGMNVRVPGQDGSNLRWFFGILAVMLFLIITLLASSALYVKFSVNRRNPPRVNAQS
nr:Alr1.2 [Starmerella bombicola]